MNGVTHKKRKWAAPVCSDCGGGLEAGRRTGRCRLCRQRMVKAYKRREREKARGGQPARIGRPPSYSDPDGERARRVGVYAEIVASGRRLFEATPRQPVTAHRDGNP